MPNSLARDFEVRRPLLQHVAESLCKELKEVITDARAHATVAFDVATSTEFMERANQLGDDCQEPLVEIVEQITGRIEIDAVEHATIIEPLLRDVLSVVSKSWLSVQELQPPELHLVCLIPPQAKPDGWRLRHDVPNAFQLLVQVKTYLGADQTLIASQPTARLNDADGTYALIMKGGGIKGLAYVGAVEQLSQRYTFNWFIGTSAGAISAVLLGAGYDADELRQILMTKDFRDFFDASWYAQPLNLLLHKGLHRADTFTYWLDELLATKLQSHTRVRLSDLPFRVTVYASRREKRALKFDSCDNDADAAHAVRSSMSIPFVFVPQNDQGFRTYDGGIQHNFPVDELLREHPHTPFISLYLGSEVYEPQRRMLVVSELLSIWTEATDPEVISQYREQTVVIDPRPIRTLDFALTSDEKEFLLASGRTAALAHLDKNGAAYANAKRERDALKVKVESERKRKRRRRQIVSGVGVAIFLICSALITWWIWLRPTDMSQRRLLEESRVDAASIDARAIDPSMPGIVVHRRTVEIDLSNEVSVAPELLDTSKIAPSVHSYSVNAERTSDEAKYLVYEFASQRRLMDINCVSDHPYAIWFRQDPLPLGKGFNNVWTLLVDVTRHSRDIPFTVKFRVTRWNAYQAENKNFVGHLVTGQEQEIHTTVYLPRGFVLADTPRLLTKKQGEPAAKWEVFTGDAHANLAGDRSSFQWTLKDPQSGYAFAAEIDWAKK